MIDELLGLEENLDHANQALLARFSEIGERLRISGFPSEKIERHTDVVERHTALADRLLKLLAGLRSAHTADDALGRENVIRELGQYFTDNIFENTPPLLSSQPLPVMMDIKKAPVVRLDRLPSPTPTPYPTLSKTAPGFDPGDLAPTIDVQFTADIIALADSLNRSPVEFYNFVRDNFEFEAYLGSRKGSQQTLDHRRGNDYDQASLLIAMLRVSGIPARYATGTVEMPIDGATNWLGIDDPVNAASLLTTAGMEGVLYYMGPDPYAIRCRRVWVEAWLPFINYRGAINDSTGFMWVPIDPTYKQYSYDPGINFPAEIGFDAEAFVNDYISTFHSIAPIALFEWTLLDTLPYCHPGATYDDLITTRSVIKETDGILPGTLPYKLIAKDGQFSEIPSNKRYRIRFHVYGSGTDLDYTTSLPEIAVKQVTISYVGATPADQQIIDDAGGIFNVGFPYIIDLKPVLKIDGCEVARGSGSIMMGVTHYSDMHFTPPTGASNQIPVVYNYIIAGNYQGIGIDTEDALPATFDIPQTSCGEDHLGQELHQAALTYLNNVDVAEDEASRLMHLVVMNDVSEAIVENTVRVLYDGVKDGVAYAILFEWTGMIVDADRKIIGPFSVDGLDNDCDYMRLGGADGSIQENRVFETRFGEEAISAVKILELAADSAITVCEITSSIAADCPGINQPSHVIDAINSALSQGHHVIIPKREFTYYNWTGTGWIDIDPVTCAAGYIISGGQNGGATVQEWDITYPKLFCIQPIGPISVFPSPAGDLYCSESNASWIFTVPTIKYWGKDSEGACVLLKSERKDFPVAYTIKELADTWGPGEYVFSAGSNTSECGCTTIEKTVTIVEIEFPSDNFTTCKGESRTMAVTVTPSGAPVTFESANPAIATVAGSAPNLTIHGVSGGQATIRAALNGLQCDTKNIAVLEVKITDPVENPVTDNNFAFDAANPGVCNVEAKGTSGVAGEDSNIEWSLSQIAGSTQTSSPDPPNGPSIAFTYTTLPSTNAQLGAKDLTLNYPKLPDACKATQKVEIFFSVDAYNHTGAGSGSTRNWYYYWKEGGVVSALVQFEYKDMDDNYGEYDPNTGKLYVGNPAPISDNYSKTFKNQYYRTSIASGVDGIASTTAIEDDIQVIPVGKGKPNATAITAGANGILDTAPSGDDGIVGNKITTGTDGICNSAKSGDDVQIIPVGKGAPNSIIITAGPDDFMHSGDGNLAGDDEPDLSNAQTEPHNINFEGIDCCAETCTHELMHRSLYDMVGGPPNPSPTADGDYVDDTYELNSPYHLDPHRRDTYNCAGTIGYGTDNEFLARMAEKNPGPRDASRDWSAGQYGKQWSK
jgi:hypothetical protein